MTGSPDGTMDVLHQLLAERARYETWLSQLEGRKAAAPGHVLERVRADYATRLEHVVTQLRGRAVELEATTATLRSRLMAVATEEETRRDERAETELRAAVGEFTGDEARETFERCDTAISSLVAQRGALGAELSRLQEVLTLVGSPEAPASPPTPPPAPAPQPEPVVTAAHVEAALDEALTVPVTAESKSALNPVEPMPTPSAAAELEFLRSIVTPQPIDAPAAEPERSDMVSPPVLSAPRRQPTPLSTSTIRDPLRAAVGESANSNVTGMNFLKDMPAEQVKTLKCQECGTMNYATEWYCERCGGELAAM